MMDKTIRGDHMAKAVASGALVHQKAGRGKGKLPINKKFERINLIREFQENDENLACSHIDYDSTGNIFSHLLKSRRFYEHSCFNKVTLRGSSLLCLTKTNCLRRSAAKIVSWVYFDTVILVFIAFSSVLLIIDGPLTDPYSAQQDALHALDLSITAIFFVEMVLKIIMDGFIMNGKGSYLRSFWNVLDMLSVIASGVSGMLPRVNVQFLKVLRILRVLRPLRVIQRNRGLKIAVLALLRSIPDILNVTIILMFFFFVFGVLGAHYFKGRFAQCAFPKSLHEQVNIASIDTIQDCLNRGAYWKVADLNFDNFPMAMLSLFVIATGSNWANLMWIGVDSRGIDLQPSY